MYDEMHEPLGLSPAPVATPLIGRLGELGRTVAGALVFAAAIGLFANARRETPRNAEPLAAAKVEPAPAPAAPTPPAASVTADAPSAIASAGQVEAASGVKVVRPGGGEPPRGIVIDVPRSLGVTLAPAPDDRVIEKSRYGPLPRVGTDGARPFQVYARPIVASSGLNAGDPKVALMIGGLGLNVGGTEAAIAELPGAVTLGFAPYSAVVDRQAAEARAAGHETVLQAPMEGFSEPAGGPGPHTLTTAASAADNFDSLYWLMGRFSGYIAVANYLGGKFTADQRAIAPVLDEISARGLGYIDDGSSPRTLGPDIARTLGMPSARADVVIDANSSPAAVDASLERLVELARERGAANGVASASPAMVERLTRWADALEAKGVALVPLSALMLKSSGSQARAKP